MTKADLDAARYLPVESEVAWCFQVNLDQLEKLGTCMQMLKDYGYRLSVRGFFSSRMLAVVDEHGAAQSVGDLDWIVFTGGEVKTIARQAFHDKYRKMTKEE